MKHKLKDVFVDNAEVLIDQLIENQVLKEIPILGTTINLIKGAFSVRDKIYLSKIKRFLENIGQISEKQRIKLITESRKDANRRAKFGESLLYTIDQSDSMAKIDYISCAFESFLNNEINDEELRLICHAVRNAFVDDLVTIVESTNTPNQVILKHNVSSGLVIANYQPKNFDMENDEPEYEISNATEQLRKAWEKYKTSKKK